MNTPITIPEIKSYMDFRGQKYPDARSALLFAYTELAECTEIRDWNTAEALHELADLYQMLQITCFESLGKLMEECPAQNQRTPVAIQCTTEAHTAFFKETILKLVGCMGKVLDYQLRAESGWTRNNPDKQISIEPAFAEIYEALHSVLLSTNGAHPRNALLSKWETKGYKPNGE